MHEPSNVSPPTGSNPLPSAGRRRLLKALVAAGGAAASAFLPPRWTSPVVEAATLPAQAQVSLVLGTGDLQATLTWNTGVRDPAAPSCISGNPDAVDLDLWVIEPDGTAVYWAVSRGPTAILDVDNQVGFGPENIFVPRERAVPGGYRVVVVYYCGQPRTDAVIRVTAFADTSRERVQKFTRTLESADQCVGYLVAEITFPEGEITELSGTLDLCSGSFPGSGSLAVCKR